MSAAVNYLGSLADRFRRLRGLSEEVAKEAVADVQAAARSSAAAGTTPAGAPWRPTQLRGRPLQNAPAAISARAVGAIVQIVLAGHHVYHSLGIGEPKRTVIPDQGDPVPPAVRDAIARAAERVLARVVGS